MGKALAPRFAVPFSLMPSSAKDDVAALGDGMGFLPVGVGSPKGSAECGSLNSGAVRITELRTRDHYAYSKP